ncbi:MAG TPA: hypothetical protein VKG82_11255 [Solirubrobacteraceae bacterium]|nr:hypothetical protein [Solirubrobacteraceae bacterium]
MGALVAAACATAIAFAPAAAASAGFGAIKGPGGCLLETGQAGGAECGEGKGLFHPSALAVSPDGANVYVVGGISRSKVDESFGTIAILKRNPATGEISDDGCLSSDGTDGRDGASGICAASPSLLGANGVTVSPDGHTVFVTASASASVVAYTRDPATGALTRLGCLQSTLRPGSPCIGANIFEGSGAPLVSASGSTLYVASPQEGTLSAFTEPAPPGPAAASEAVASAPAPPAPPAPAGLASVFGAPPGGFIRNACIAVNGYDGDCAVGVAMQGVGALTLSPDGKQLYAVAAASHAIDEFSPTAAEPLAEIGCLKQAAPKGLCSSSEVLQEPTQLAVSPDGHNVYVADGSTGAGRIDILTRNASTGSLSDAGCVDYLPPPVKEEPNEEDEEEKAERREREKAEKEKSAETPDSCVRVPGLEDVQSLAVSGDGSAVYAFGSSSAVSFARDAASGALTETGCASDEDARCTAMPDLKGAQAAAVSPDGRDVYVATVNAKAVLAFGVGASVTSTAAAASRSGLAHVSVACPAHLARPCRGQVLLTRVVRMRARRGAGERRVRVAAGRSGVFAIGAGDRALVTVRLYGSAHGALLGERRLRVTASVRAERFAGGSAFGRRLLLRLARR